MRGRVGRHGAQVRALLGEAGASLDGGDGRVQVGVDEAGVDDVVDDGLVEGDFRVSGMHGAADVAHDGGILEEGAFAGGEAVEEGADSGDAVGLPFGEVLVELRVDLGFPVVGHGPVLSMALMAWAAGQPVISHIGVVPAAAAMATRCVWVGVPPRW
jgi:hypothetical protein